MLHDRERKDSDFPRTWVKLQLCYYMWSLSKAASQVLFRRCAAVHLARRAPSTVCAVLLALQDCCSCGSTWRWALWARVVVSCKFHVAAGIVSTFGQGFLQNKPWHIWDATSSDLHKDAQYRHTFWFSFWTSTIRQVMFSCAFSSTAAKSRYLRLS